MDPIDKTVDLGDDGVTFNCTYEALDVNATDVLITWTGPNAIDVQNTAISNVSGTFTSVLTLMTVTQGHAGMYSCSATENDTTVDSMEASLTVSCKPMRVL